MGLENFTVHPSTPPLVLLPVLIPNGQGTFALRDISNGDDLSVTSWVTAMVPSPASNEAQEGIAIGIVYTPNPLPSSFEASPGACPDGWECIAHRWVLNEADVDRDKGGDEKELSGWEVGIQGLDGGWRARKEEEREGWGVWWMREGEEGEGTRLGVELTPLPLEGV